MVYARAVLRKQIYLDESDDRQVRKLARAEGRSAAALIREAIRSYLERRAEAPRDPLREVIGAFEGGSPDASVAHDAYLYQRDRD